uniref:Uncharacterized protein n=1 Tax=Candidatus Kentrum sp. LPFa TaxID=2126335 RepID=A0A450X8U5_9GAMM|nr:MAG: hypothetical protein BECKLPF1236A_GA0070988_1002817 [Candidatus Kentron sp. LPFa]VFK25715.1 MAG: hypothetical protein BECKLPF1236C_GA0070990_1002418 [Candidatus Kentron sp. LPFa]
MKMLDTFYRTITNDAILKADPNFLMVDPGASCWRTDSRMQDSGRTRSIPGRRGSG